MELEQRREEKDDVYLFESADVVLLFQGHIIVMRLDRTVRQESELKKKQ